MHVIVRTYIIWHIKYGDTNSIKSITMEMLTWWWSGKPKENYLRKNPLRGKPSPKRQCTIFREVLQFSIKPLYLDSTNHRWAYSRNLLLLQKLWTLQYMDAFMDDTLVFMTGTSNWLQKPLEILFYIKKFVVTL